MALAGSIDKEKIYSDYYEKVLRLCMSKVTIKEEAEDLASNIFVKVYEKLDSYDPSKAALSTWIYTIANHTIIDYYRAYKLHVEVPEDMSEDGSIDDDLLNNETLSELAAALKQLPERERDIIILKYYELKTLKEIAQLMHMSYANAKILHGKALSYLKKKLEV